MRSDLFRLTVRSSRRPAAVAIALIVAAGCSSSSTRTTAPSTTSVAATATSSSTASVTSSAPTGPPSTTASPAPTTVVPSTTVVPPTTLSPAQLAADYSKPGPFPVGVTKLALPAGNEVVVWYPAVPGTTGTFTYDVRDYNSPAIKALLTADIPATFSIDAGLDAAVADGRHPLALYSHGFSGIDVGSSFLTATLASYGVVVAAPDHPSRDLASATSGKVGDQTSAVTDLLATVTLLHDQDATSGGRFSGHVDTAKVVAIGHSAGGGTVLSAAADPSISAYVSLASGALGQRSTDGSSTTVAPPPMPAKPSLFIAGKVDTVVPWETVTKPAYDAAPSPSALWVIDGVGHNGFDDFCTFGNGKGIIGIAEASGLGPFLDTNPQFRKLGQDGCIPPAVPVEQAWPIIRHAVTAFALQQFGNRGATADLQPSLAGAFGLPVTIQQK